MLHALLALLGASPDAIGTSEARYTRRNVWAIALLFIGEKTFPLANVWQAFLSSAPTPFTFSVHVGLDEPEKLPEPELAALLAVGAHIIPARKHQRGVETSGSRQTDAMLMLLRTALRDQPHAQRFCLLPALSTPIFNFSDVYWALMNDPRSSVPNACDGSQTRAPAALTLHQRTWGTRQDNDASGGKAGVWSVLTRSHAELVLQSSIMVAKRPMVAGNLVASVLAYHNTSNDDLECSATVIRRTPLAKPMTPAMLLRLRKPCHQSDGGRFCNNCRPCARFIQHTPAVQVSASLKTMCADAVATDPTAPAGMNPDTIAVINSAPCRAHGMRSWRKFTRGYMDMLSTIRQRGKEELTAQTAAKKAWSALETPASASSLVNGHPAKRLVFAYTFWLPKWEKAVASLVRWSRIGDACSGKYAPHMTLLMAPGMEDGSETSAMLQTAQSAFSDPISKVQRCFNSVRWYDKSRFSEGEAKYPLSAGLQFFQFMADPDLKASFDVLWLMETDIEPIRPLFLDALYHEAIEPMTFMIKGTMHRGFPGFERVGAEKGSEPSSMLEDLGWALRSQEWLSHMNGAALYGLGDPVLDEIARAAKVLQISNVGVPFDVLLFLVLADALGDTSLRHPEKHEVFPLLQYVSARLIYTEFVWNVGSQAGRHVVRGAAKAAGTYLLHGQDGFLAMRDSQRAVSTLMLNKTRVAMRNIGCPFQCGFVRGHGECRKNTCVCNAGWMGPACAHKGDAAERAE